MAHYNMAFILESFILELKYMSMYGKVCSQTHHVIYHIIQTSRFGGRDLTKVGANVKMLCIMQWDPKFFGGHFMQKGIPSSRTFGKFQNRSFLTHPKEEKYNLPSFIFIISSHFQSSSTIYVKAKCSKAKI